MIATGEAEIAPSIAVQDATDPKTDFSYLNGETTRIRIGTEQQLLNDIRVRQALNYAVDRNAFVGSVLSQDSFLHPSSSSLRPIATIPISSPGHFL